MPTTSCLTLFLSSVFMWIRGRERGERKVRLEADWTKFEYSQYGHSRNSKKSHMIYHCLTAVWNGQETLEIHTHLLMRKTWLNLLHIRHKISARLFGKKSYYSTEMKWSKKNQDNANENEESSAWHRNRKARREKEREREKQEESPVSSVWKSHDFFVIVFMLLILSFSLSLLCCCCFKPLRWESKSRNVIVEYPKWKHKHARDNWKNSHFFFNLKKWDMRKCSWCERDRIWDKDWLYDGQGFEFI